MQDLTTGPGQTSARSDEPTEQPRGDASAQPNDVLKTVRVTVQDAPSITTGIADAVVLKDGNVYFLTAADGNVPLEEDHGYGLYYHDCRYLNGYELRLAGHKLDTLVSTAAQGFVALSQLTTPDLRLSDGQVIPRESLGITWERIIDSAQCALHDVITLQNFGPRRMEFPISLAFRAEFEDVFAVRGLPYAARGTLLPPRWADGVLEFGYEGSDALTRRVAVRFSGTPSFVDGTTVEFAVSLAPGERQDALVTVAMSESESGSDGVPDLRHAPNLQQAKNLLEASASRWLASGTEIRASSLTLNTVLDRSLRDLRLLRSQIDGQEFFSAGVPWYATLFGRDSLLTALQTLVIDPRIAEQTLRVLAANQGTREDPWRDEEPGKILHELRVGEMARAGVIPHTPYYGTIDATVLFLMLVAEHTRWTGSLALFHELRENVERALEWIARYGDQDGDGYLEYRSESSGGLVNQGWKDADDAIVNADGSLATPPIALVEVQGYVYAAKIALADVYQQAGSPARAQQLRREAGVLRTRFNQDFWVEEIGSYALALQAGKRPAAVVSSNPGQALWCGIVDPGRAAAVVERLMAPDMFSGWGIRTLSTAERRYNPMSYQLGSVWPHDTALIAAGFRRYGFRAEAARLFERLVEAAVHFPDARLPELFTGFSREEFGVPVPYPVACRPQAWAAGAAPFLVQTLLGLEPRGSDRVLRIVRPILPEMLQWVELRRLQVAGAQVDLRFERSPRGLVAVDVLKVDGDLEVVLELGRA